MFEDLFKSKKKRRLEREAAVRQAVALHRRRVKELQKHEREYAAMAVRAKREGDNANYRRIVRLLAQTVNERRRVQSSLLSFEALIQTHKRVEGFASFANGVRNAAKAISEVVEGLDMESVVAGMEKAVVEAQSLDEVMDGLLERMSDALFEAPESAADGAVTPEEIDEMLDEEAKHSEHSASDEIDRLLESVERKIKESK